VDENLEESPLQCLNYCEPTPAPRYITCAEEGKRPDFWGKEIALLDTALLIPRLEALGDGG
jgi:hypothetical protein